MVLVDSSVWIEYFRGNTEYSFLDELLDNNEIAVNEIILTELIPPIHQRKEWELAELLLVLPKLVLEINWPEIRSMQLLNLVNGINKVGLPDLIIAQNCLQNGLELLSRDRHFALMAPLHDLSLFKRQAI